MQSKSGLSGTWLAILAAVGIVGLCLFVMSGRHRPKGAVRAFAQIKEGMSESQVEKLIGSPPGWYAKPGREPVMGRAPRSDFFTKAGVRGSGGSVRRGWGMDDGWILIDFDSEGRV